MTHIQLLPLKTVDSDRTGALAFATVTGYTLKDSYTGGKVKKRVKNIKIQVFHDGSYGRSISKWFSKASVD